jgi:hypothetical protein
MMGRGRRGAERRSFEKMGIEVKKKNEHQIKRKKSKASPVRSLGVP